VTEVHVVVDDAAFLRVPAGLAYAVLTDVGSWPSWWPGTGVVDGRDGSFALRLGRGPGAIALTTTPSDWRHDRGFRTDPTGDVVGRCEWWLEPVAGGVVLHHLLDARTTRRGLRGRYRAHLRRGLWSLKDVLEASVRLALASGPMVP